MTITFISSYFKIYENEYDISKSFENRLKYFILLLDLGINICIFIQPKFISKFDELTNKYKNLKIIQQMELEDLEFYKLTNNVLFNLPNTKNVKKDTQNYLLLMLEKTEFVAKVIQCNPFNTKYFAWIDFNLPYIFKDQKNTLNKIRCISNYNFKQEFLFIPGCWKRIMNDIEYLKNNIVWRFCGGFFMGDKQSLLIFNDICKRYLLDFISLTQNIVWEVNYWAWLENNNLIFPVWNQADHDDTIINIPNEIMDY